MERGREISGDRLNVDADPAQLNVAGRQQLIDNGASVVRMALPRPTEPALSLA